MKKLFVLFGIICLLATSGLAQFTFYLIDNFEDNNYTEGPRWWKFGGIEVTTVKNARPEKRDLITESCGDYSLNLSGKSTSGYVGGMGTDLGVDATSYARFQIDLSGLSGGKGKLVIELFEDDNDNYSIEQDSKNDYAAVADDKWVAEVPIQGSGFTRTSIPFSAFKDGNPGIGDDIWNPEQIGGSGGLLKMQIVAITEQEQGTLNFKIDNMLLTY